MIISERKKVFPVILNTIPGILFIIGDNHEESEYPYLSIVIGIQ